MFEFEDRYGNYDWNEEPTLYWDTYSIDGIKDFPDQKDIAEYAVQPTKYMAKNILYC